MKEAAGEANMTVITIVLIGVVAAAGLLLIPRLLDNVSKRTACDEMGGTLNGTTCNYKDSLGTNKSCTVIKCSSGPQQGNWICGTCPTR